VAIGNFDGVHTGHRALLRSLFDDAEQMQLVPTVLTFFPHPAQVLGRGQQPVLTRLDYRLQLLTRTLEGLQVLVQPFTKQLASLTPEQFARDVLVQRCRAKRVLVGENFRFGKDRAGDLSTLRALGDELGFAADAVGLVELDGDIVSSSRIRTLVAAGEIEAANRLLGRPYALAGRVVSGQQLGRQLGFPTANLADVEELWPANGVYACWVNGIEAHGPLAAVCNVGERPTVSGQERRIEVFVLEYSGDLYGRELTLHLCARLRGEQRFGSLDELRAQIARDVERASQLLR
jgi:riboflavin kinase/FMN adenylyltransferase